MRVRPADPQTLRDVRLRALADAPDAFAATLEQEGAFTEAQWRERCAGSFLAEDGERAVGMAGGFETGAPGVVRLWGMWIEPAARGRGAAEGLVEAVEQWARERGAQELELAVAEQAPAALRAYERMGFELMPERELLRAGGDLYTRRMRRLVRQP